MVRYTIHCILGNDILLRINVSGVATFDWCAFFGFMVHKIHLLFLFFPTARSCILDHRYDKYTHFFHFVGLSKILDNKLRRGKPAEGPHR